MNLFRLHKPNEQGILHRTYRVQGNFFLVLKAVTFFRLTKYQELFEERDGWLRLMDQLKAHQYLDICMPKAFPEVLHSGSAFSPGGVPLTKLSVGLRIGSLRKDLEVLGDRIWQKKWLGYKQTEPAQFSKMPLSWENSYGFNASDINPNGVGNLSAGSANEVLVSLPNMSTANLKIFFKILTKFYKFKIAIYIIFFRHTLKFFYIVNYIFCKHTNILFIR